MERLYLSLERLLSYLAPNGFAFLFLLLALGTGAWLLLWYRRQASWSRPLLVTGAAALLVAGGGLFLPPGTGVWVAGGALAVLFVQLLWLVMTTQWFAPLAAAVAAIFLVGVGGWCNAPASEGLGDLFRTAANVQLVHPWWLLLLLLLPFIVLVSFRSLAGLGPVRRCAAIGLRCLLIALLAFALAEPRFRQPNDTVTVLFVVDRSLSVPPEIDPKAPPDSKEATEDLRWKRLQRFMKESVEKRGDDHKRDKYGLIVFGRQPRLELPPSDAKKFGYAETPGAVDPNYTDIAGALKLALASFPEGTGKRVVLLSDGNENLGNAVEQARLAEKNGLQIDVVPLAANYKNETEVLVQSVEAPPLTEQGSRFPIRVLLRSYNPNPVAGIVTLRRIVNGESQEVKPGLENPGGKVVLRPGLNSVIFPPPPERPVGSFTYIARFEPKGVVVGDQLLPPPRGHLQNKEATTHVLAQGQRKVLLVENKAGEHEFLYEHLTELERKTSKFRVDRCTAARLSALNKSELGLFLADYDCLILANLPAEALSEEQQEMIRANTHDQGCGLIMIGGPDSFGAGGWQGTPVEKALPVDCDIKAMKVQQPGGLVLIFHASEAEGQNSWQKTIGRLAIQKLAPDDMVGVLQYDGFGADNDGATWQVPFQRVGEKRNKIMKLVDAMNPGDMPDCNPSFRKSLKELTKAEYKLGKRHIIFISDGDHWRADPQLLGQMLANKITCTTVLVTTHGNDPSVVMNMKGVADATRGRFHNVTNPKALPEIYTKEARLVSQSFLYERPFRPKLVSAGGPADKLPEELERLYGFVRTTAKLSPLVEKAILGPPQGDQDFPVLAFWQYGLGKSVAFTSDARSGAGKQTWDREWAPSPMYKRFWEQMVDWSLRAVESGALTMTTEYRDGKVKVIVEARDKNNQNRPITDLRLRGAVTTPSGKVEEARKGSLKFEQKSSGRYEAEFKAEEAGSYFIAAQPVRFRKVQRKVIENGKEVIKEEEREEPFDSVRAGVTVPYSPEFADMESNAGLLEELRRMTGGNSYMDDGPTLTDVAASGQLFRQGPPQARSMQPFWHWLVFLAGFVLVADVAVRRIAVEPQVVVVAAAKVWDKLRGRVPVAAASPQFLDRLRSRKEQVGETLERKAAARFDAGEGPTAAPAGADASAAPAPTSERPTTPQPSIAPQKEEVPQDFASRLMKAKKKVWEERDKGKNP
jgi:uncharacterized membrane protein